MNFYFDFSVFSGEYLDYTGIIYAIIVGVLTSLCASVMGVNLVLKRYSMIGDGLSHVGFLALAVAALLGISGDNVMYITAPIVIIASIFLMWLSDSGRLKGDAATALVSVGTVAVGYILFAVAEAGTGAVCSGLFGATSVLTMRYNDLITASILCLAVILMYFCNYNKIFAVTFDESFAKSGGINVKGCNMILSIMTAITIVVGMKLIGSIMISAIIVIPAVTAMRIFKSFKAVVISSGIISVLCFIMGFLFAVTFVIEKDNGIINNEVMLPVGATVVCFNILVLIIVFVYKLFTSIRKSDKIKHSV